MHNIRSKIHQIALEAQMLPQTPLPEAGALPQTPLGELTALSQTFLPPRKKSAESQNVHFSKIRPLPNPRSTTAAQGKGKWELGYVMLAYYWSCTALYILFGRVLVFLGTCVSIWFII
jgi:hypothetical protein